MGDSGWRLVVLARMAAAAAMVALAVAAEGLGPLAFVALVAAIFVGEAAIEMRQAPPAGERPQRALPFRAKGRPRAL